MDLGLANKVAMVAGASRGLGFGVALALVWSVVPSMFERGGGAILLSTSASVKEPLPNLGGRSQNLFGKSARCVSASAASGGSFAGERERPRK